jgi:hypothetical protein
LILLCQWHHTGVHEGGVTITRDSNRWVFTKPDGRSCDPWVSDQNLAQHIDVALRGNDSMHRLIMWLRWTASSTPTPASSDLAGLVNPSTCTPASEPSSPSSFPSQLRTLINKRRSWSSFVPVQ